MTIKRNPWDYPNPYPMFSKEALAYSERKMAHYNEWLMNKRSSGQPYPGFPEDLNRVSTQSIKGKKMLTPSTPEVATNVMNSVVATLSGDAPKFDAKPTKGKAKAADRVKGKAREGSKLEQAISIFAKNGGDKTATIADIQNLCGMSLAGATTYFYNAKKASK